MKYHISKAGNIVQCKATKQACKATPSDGFTQFHSEDRKEIEQHLTMQYNEFSTISKNVIKTYSPLPKEINLEVIGDEATDHQRLDEWSVSQNNFGNTSYLETFMHDAEGRPMGYIKLMDNDGALMLCDVEIREEYRGYKLGQRLIKAASKNTGREITHDGGYTLAGYKALYPMFKNERIEEVKESSSFQPMSFVLDWDRKFPVFPI